MDYQTLNPLQTVPVLTETYSTVVDVVAPAVDAVDVAVELKEACKGL